MSDHDGDPLNTVHVSDYLRVKAERDRYRQGLVYISSQQSGIWGQIAHDALNDKRQAGSDASAPDTSPPEGSSSAHVP